MADRMWAYRLEGPLTFARHEVDQPRPGDMLPGDVVLRFLAGGICGSDTARCLDAGCSSAPGAFGLSLHEIVGEVVESRSDLAVGDRVVGWVGQSLGLCEFVRTGADALTPVPAGIGNVQAVPLQPLACVLHGVARLPDVTGAEVAIIGLGPIGLLFAHALCDRGVAGVTGVDVIDRSDVAGRFGISRVETRHSRTWAGDPANRDRFDLVIEAVGHQVGTMHDALAVAAPGGTVMYYGNPDDRYYPIDFGAMMDKALTLVAGRTPQPARREALVRALEYLRRHPGVFESYVTHVLPVEDVQKAYELASRPAPGRLKVVLEAATP